MPLSPGRSHQEHYKSSKCKPTAENNDATIACEKVSLIAFSCSAPIEPLSEFIHPAILIPPIRINGETSEIVRHSHCSMLDLSSYTLLSNCLSFNLCLLFLFLQDPRGRTFGSKPSAKHNQIRHAEAMSHHAEPERLRRCPDRWTIK